MKTLPLFTLGFALLLLSNAPVLVGYTHIILHPEVQTLAKAQQEFYDTWRAQTDRYLSCQENPYACRNEYRGRILKLERGLNKTAAQRLTCQLTSYDRSPLSVHEAADWVALPDDAIQQRIEWLKEFYAELQSHYGLDPL